MSECYISLKKRDRPPTVNPCTILGCGKKIDARGYCSMHYQRWQKYGDPLKTFQKPKCKVDGCDRPNRTQGFCGSHQRRWKLYGDPLTMRMSPQGSGYRHGGYKRYTKNGRRIMEHRLVWERHNGPVPDGYLIHHKNHDKSDNRIENLELMRWGDHTRMHLLERASAKQVGR